MTLTQSLKGRASAWLLSRPSNQQINRTSLIAAFAVCLALLVAIIGLSLAQWILSERLQLTRIEREQHLARHAETSLKMAVAASNAHRATISALVARDDLEMSDSIQRREAALDIYDSALDSTTLQLSSATLEKKQSAAALAQNYRSLSAQLIEMVQKGDTQKALDFRLHNLRPVYEKWQVAHNEFSQNQTREILQNDATQIQTIRILRRILFALVLAPVALITICTFAVFAILGLGYLARPTPTTPDPWSH